MNKNKREEVFEINDELKVVCVYNKTKNGFTHTATLYRNDSFVKTVKTNYMNRAYERFEFNSVMLKLAEKTNVPEIAEFVRNRDAATDANAEGLKLISKVAKYSDFLFEKTPSIEKEKNKFRRELLESMGIEFPKEFDSLPEEEKSKRLLNAFGVLDEK